MSLALPPTYIHQLLAGRGVLAVRHADDRLLRRLVVVEDLVAVERVVGTGRNKQSAGEGVVVFEGHVVALILHLAYVPCASTTTMA